MFSDPIAALATPAGRSALALLRLSGEGVFPIAARVIRGFQVQPARTQRLAEFVGADGVLLDRGLYACFPAPASYTGQDLVELSCHGGLVVPAAVLSALYAAGARPALPGEFTRRAVLNGKMDLVQAEAIGDLIDATAPAQAGAALRQMDGALSRRLGDLRDRIVGVQALLSYDIDFPEEDDGPVAPARIRGALQDTLQRIDRLLQTAPAGERLREGALVVIAGRPNAGKSSLLNALIGSRRVLVSERPGTTRDAVEVHTDFEGWPIRLVDTAGLGEFADPLDRSGVDMSRSYIDAGDLILLCVEAGLAVEPAESARPADRTVLLRTKADLIRPEGEGIPVSVVTGEGVAELRREAARRLFRADSPRADLEPALTRERHRVALARARTELLAAGDQLTAGDPVLAAHHIQDATLALDELIGVVDIEQVLDRVFASFCVGK